MRRLEAAVALAVLAAPCASAQERADSGDARVRHHREFLASTDWLAAHLRDGGVVVVQVGRTDSAYRAGHVPGARFLPLAAVATTVAGVPNEFPPPGTMAAAFRNLGAGDRERVVLYGDDAGLLAARAWVALDLLGHTDRAAILDGGLAKWTAEGRALETAPRAGSPAPFTARWRGNGVVGAEWVRAHLGDSTVVFVDARARDQYAGAAGARSGHLPGASDLFWMAALVSRDDPVLKPMHALHEELWKATGADRPGVRTVVTYCQTGMQASHAYFVARYVGYPDVRLYDGSMAEWSALPAATHPLERATP